MHTSLRTGGHAATYRLSETIRYAGAEQLDSYYELCGKHNNAEWDQLVRVSSPGSLTCNVVMDYIWEIVIVILESPLCSRGFAPTPPPGTAAQSAVPAKVAAKPVEYPPLRLKLDVTCKKLDAFAPRDSSSELGFGLLLEDVTVRGVAFAHAMAIAHRAGGGWRIGSCVALLHSCMRGRCSITSSP